LVSSSPAVLEHSYLHSSPKCLQSPRQIPVAGYGCTIASTVLECLYSRRTVLQRLLANHPLARLRTVPIYLDEPISKHRILARMSRLRFCVCGEGHKGLVAPVVNCHMRNSAKFGEVVRERADISVLLGDFLHYKGDGIRC